MIYKSLFKINGFSLSSLFLGILTLICRVYKGNNLKSIFKNINSLLKNYNIKHNKITNRKIIKWTIQLQGTKIGKFIIYKIKLISKWNSHFDTII